VTVKATSSADPTKFATATVTLTAPAPVPTAPVPTAGLQLWLRADSGITQSGGAISQWADQSGSGRHAAQALAARQPQLQASAVNGRPALAFDGVDDFLTFDLPLNGLTGMTMMMVSANAANRNGGANGVAYAPLFWNETTRWGTVHLSPFQSAIQFRFGTTQANNLSTYTRPVSAGSSFGLTTAVKNGSVERLYVQGQLALTATGKLTAIKGIRDTGNIGRGYNDNTYFPGRIAEILVYNRALGDAERQQLEQYLLAKYFVAVSVSNLAPVVKAGPDQAVNTLAASLAGSVTDDGLPKNALTVGWSKLNGPGVVTFANSASAVTTATFSTSGTYVLRLTASDSALTSFDDLTVTISETPPPSTVPTGMVAYWPFQEGSGTTVTDASGNGKTATAYATTWTTGKSGYALNFNGSTSYVNAGAIDVPGAALTISAWFKADSLPTTIQPRIISKATGLAEADHYFMLSTIYSGGNKLRFRLKTSGTTKTLIASSGSVGLGVWVHAVATYDGSTMRLYKDGVLVGSMSVSGSINTNSGVPTWIGSNPVDGNRFDGVIDEVRIYNRALSATEVTNLYQTSQ
jgi:hypothetical protein